MLITNLTTEKYKYDIDNRFIEKCLSGEHYRWFRWTVMVLHSHICHSDDGVLFYMNDRDNSYYDIIRQIPIFLVSKSECLKKFSVRYFGHTDNFLVPDDVLRDDVAGVKPENGIIDGDEINPYRDENDMEKELQASIDLLGLYTRHYPKGKPYSIEESQPRIFIWVDKIWDIVKEDRHKFRILSTQVILHELAHAMMDVNLLGSQRCGCNSFSKYFYTLKEESLANAIALTLMKNNVNQSEWDFVVDFVKTQPFQYALGLEYLDASGHVVERSAWEWMDLKTASYYSNTVINEWMNYIKGPYPLDCKQLLLLDEGMTFTEGLYKYNGKYYDNHDMCIQVIKDYIAQYNPSRAELHAAFPDSLNSLFEAVIDYPNQKEFIDKTDKSTNHPHTRSVFNENIVKCSDEEVAICDYWYPDDIVRFISNANKFGIQIGSF